MWSFLLIPMRFQVSSLLAVVADTFAMAFKKSWVLAGFSSAVYLINLIGEFLINFSFSFFTSRNRRWQDNFDADNCSPNNHPLVNGSPGQLLDRINVLRAITPVQLPPIFLGSK